MGEESETCDEWHEGWNFRQLHGPGERVHYFDSCCEAKIVHCDKYPDEEDFFWRKVARIDTAAMLNKVTP